jgi:hypothetical protein
MDDGVGVVFLDFRVVVPPDRLISGIWCYGTTLIDVCFWLLM